VGSDGKGQEKPDLGEDARLRALLRHRRPLIVIVHALLVALALLTAFLLRFDFSVPRSEWGRFLQALPVLLAIRLGAFAFFRLFEGMWRYVSVRDLTSIATATVVGTVGFMAAELLLFGYGFPRSAFILEGVLTFLFVGGIRFVIRAVREQSPRLSGGDVSRALIVGAGDGAEQLIRSIQASLTEGYELVGMVDDDVRKYRTRIRGVTVIGGIDDIPGLIARLEVDEILVATPSASLEERRRVLQLCRRAGVPVRSVPSLRELVEGRARIGQLERVDPATLISRDEIRIDLERIRRELEDRVVFVTGAGGSIGSELCRQIAPFSPARIVLLDRSESSLYFTHLELSQRFPGLDLFVAIGDICDEPKLMSLMDEHKPQVVFHAAAYKHVPLMEAHPLDAVQNNIFGTETVARAAVAAGVPKFVLISTDKAVAPLGIMGMSKRVAEGVLLAMEERGSFVSVRFGNVLGSAGSVIPIFHWQLSQGAPLTVTDQEATRFFMLLSEAAQLVLQAAAMGKSGDIFFLDMGEPVRIGQLAEDFIRMSGMQPDKTTMRSVGMRPGEKMVEQLVAQTEDLGPSEHEKIYRLNRSHFDVHAFRTDLEELRAVTQQREVDEVVRILTEMASEY
jgi:FlaA1/EpsC-like NDP-sugar epimerase